MQSAIVSAVLRHALGAAGAALASTGYATADESQAAVGAVATLAAFGWSIWQKMRRA